MKKALSCIVLLLFSLTFMACTKKSEDERSKAHKEIGEKATRTKKRAVIEVTPEEVAKSYDEAIAKYTKAISTKPNDAMAYYSLGIIYRKKGVDLQAAEHLYKAGILFIEQNKRNNALKAYEELQKTNAKELAQDLFEKLNPK